MQPYKTIALTIAPQTNLHLGDESGIGNFEHTTAYIPGSAIRGSLAKKIINAERKDDYQQLFDSDDIFFENAYPGHVPPVYIFPLTTQTCKHNQGIRSTEDKAWMEKHDVFDLLINRFVYEILTDPDFPARDSLLPGMKGSYASITKALDETCPKCHGGLVPYNRYYVMDTQTGDDDGISLQETREIQTRRRAHVGINRARAVAEDSIFFTQEIIEPGSRFYGQVFVPEHKSELLESYLKGEHFLGRGRSRGQGRVLIGVDKGIPKRPLKLRIQQFNQKIQSHLGYWREQDGRIPNQFEGTFFSITLNSPAILERYGEPYLLPTPLDIHMPGAILMRAWTHAERVGGWNAAAKLPRRTRLAAVTGSVYLYYLPGKTGTWETLEELELMGLGEERTRGFGRVDICHPIHSHKTLR